MYLGPRSLTLVKRLAGTTDMMIYLKFKDLLPRGSHIADKLLLLTEGRIAT